MKRIPVLKGTLPRTEYRQMLLERRQEVLSSLGVKFDTLASMGRLAEEDQAPISHDEFISLHMNSLDHQELLQIEEALERWNSGEYGLCLECGEPISAKRLEAIPWARYCIDCQNRIGTPQAA